MSEAILKSLNELLNEEKWTRAALNNYTIHNFKELDKVVAEINGGKLESETQKICEEHLKHSKNSIIALYISGVISLGKQLVDDANLIILINIFSDNRKWQIVEYLCQRILEFGENKEALRTLADCYENSNEEEKKLAIWERLIKVDYEEAEFVKNLAEKSEEADDIEKAVDYYKKALHRFVNKKMFSNVREIWAKLLEYAPEDMDFFFRVERKVSTTLSEDRAAALLHLLFPIFKQNEDWDNAITILKKLLTYEPKNQDARKDLIECYRAKYQDHSQLDDYIRLSNLNQNWRNVYDAINDFEKHIAFDVGNYVFHRDWGIGRINEIQDDTVTIDFAQKRGHQMSLKMAVSALKILHNDHIWVLKGLVDKKELKNRVKSDPVWALKVIIRSFENNTNVKTIKAELVPSVLTPGEWTKWNTEARKILKTNPDFGTLPDKRDQFEVRDLPISFEEKTYNKFKAEKIFFNRVQYIQDFLTEAEPDSDFFKDMLAYFTGFLKSPAAASEFVVSSFLLVQRIVNIYPFLNPGLDFDFGDILNEMEDVPAIFSKIEDTDLKKDFLLHVKRQSDEWPAIYAKLFRFYLSRFIIDELVSAERIDVIKTMFGDFVRHYRDDREAFVWLARNLSDEEWFEKLDITMEKILICLIHLLDITYREINNRRDVSLNRKVNRQIQDYLFKDEKLREYLVSSDEESATRLYTLIEDVKELDPSMKVEVVQNIRDKFPNFHFAGEDEKETVSRGLLVTRSGYGEKQKQLRNILEMEIPQNSKEIGKAMEKGDLRENAEYKAALEKQDLLNATAAKIQAELGEAQVFDESDVDTSTISFGTKVVLLNLENDKNEEYIILGPWESDPSEKIISYLSPIGTNLFAHKMGEEVEFSVNDKSFRYKVQNIEKAPIVMT